MCLKLLVGEWLATCISAYTPQMGRSVEEKDCFWDQMLCVTGIIPASELIIVGGGPEWQKNKLATYVSGSTVSTTDYLLLRCD